MPTADPQARARLQRTFMIVRELVLVVIAVAAVQACVIGAENRALLQTIAGVARDPLTVSWTALDGGTYSVTVSCQEGWTDEEWHDAFDERVARSMRRHPRATAEPLDTNHRK